MHVQMQMQMHPNVSTLLLFCCLFFFLFPKREVLSRLGYAAFGKWRGEVGPLPMVMDDVVALAHFCRGLQRVSGTYIFRLVD